MSQEVLVDTRAVTLEWWEPHKHWGFGGAADLSVSC